MLSAFYVSLVPGASPSVSVSVGWHGWNVRTLFAHDVHIDDTGVLSWKAEYNNTQSRVLKMQQTIAPRTTT
jgi:hypothetical protein